MKIIICTLFIIIYSLVLCCSDVYEDNEFAEFENFDDEEDDFVGISRDNAKSKDSLEIAKSRNNGKSSLDVKNSNSLDDEYEYEIVEEEVDEDDDDEDDDEDDEFEHFQDEEEFEGYEGNDIKEFTGESKTGEPKLNVAKVPLHFRTHWDQYWMEILMIAGLTIYFINFFFGKNKNAKLANMWLNTHRSILEENFILVGDDGKLENECPGLIKESENLYTLWCSGRTCCEGMLVELKMIKRQDLIALISMFMRPTQTDQIHIKVDISKDAMDTFVFCVATKKAATKFFKDLSDLNKFCNLVNKADEKYNVPTGYSVLSEIPEASINILDSRVLNVLNKYSNIEYIHISDQFSGPIQQDQDTSNLKQPEVKRVLMAGFNIPTNCDMELLKPLLLLIFYLMEKLKRFRLSKEAKSKADKNRLRVEEQFLKSTHAARAEAALLRKEEKRKLEKERVMAEDDPEKQRRWEEKEQKRQAKRKAPKMKRLAVKSL